MFCGVTSQLPKRADLYKCLLTWQTAVMLIELLITVHLIQQGHPLIKASGIINAWSAFSRLRSKVLRACTSSLVTTRVREESLLHASKQISVPKHALLGAPSSFCNSLPSSISLLTLLSVFQEFSRSAGQKAFGGREKRRKAKERKRTAGLQQWRGIRIIPVWLLKDPREGPDSFTSVYIGNQKRV